MNVWDAFYNIPQNKPRIRHLQQHDAHGRTLAWESKENLSNQVFEVKLMVPWYGADFQEKKKNSCYNTEFCARNYRKGIYNFHR